MLGKCWADASVQSLFCFNGYAVVISLISIMHMAPVYVLLESLTIGGTTKMFPPSIRKLGDHPIVLIIIVDQSSAGGKPTPQSRRLISNLPHPSQENFDYQLATVVTLSALYPVQKSLWTARHPTRTRTRISKFATLGKMPVFALPKAVISLSSPR